MSTSSYVLSIYFAFNKRHLSFQVVTHTVPIQFPFSCRIPFPTRRWVQLAFLALLALLSDLVYWPQPTAATVRPPSMRNASRNASLGRGALVWLQRSELGSWPDHAWRYVKICDANEIIIQEEHRSRSRCEDVWLRFTSRFTIDLWVKPCHKPVVWIIFFMFPIFVGMIQSDELHHFQGGRVETTNHNSNYRYIYHKP